MQTIINNIEHPWIGKRQRRYVASRTLLCGLTFLSARIWSLVHSETEIERTCIQEYNLSNYLKIETKLLFRTGVWRDESAGDYPSALSHRLPPRWKPGEGRPGLARRTAAQVPLMTFKAWPHSQHAISQQMRDLNASRQMRRRPYWAITCSQNRNAVFSREQGSTLYPKEK